MKYPYLKIALAVALGLLTLWLPALLHAWTGPTFFSIKPCPDGSKFGNFGAPPCASGPTRQFVDEWQWKFLNKWYGNSEDGVSGQYAYLWDAKGNLVSYYSTFASWVPIWIRAYAWSAWRNSANNLKRPYRGDSLTGIVA